MKECMGLLQFAKRNEMKICSLRNDKLLSRCIYSDILNRKLQPKKAVSPRKFRLRGMRDVFVATYKVQAQAFLSDGQQPEARPLPFSYALMPPHYSYRDDLPENLPQNHCPRMQKVHFRWPLKRLILTRNITRYSNEPIKYIIVALLFTFEHGGFNVLYR